MKIDKITTLCRLKKNHVKLTYDTYKRSYFKKPWNNSDMSQTEWSIPFE